MQRRTPWSISILVSVLALVAVACGSDDGDGGGDEIPALSVTGTIVDFETGDPLTGSATVSTDGIDPPPIVSVTGSDFSIDEIPPFSVFHILAGSPPDYRSTYNVATVVEDSDLSGVTVAALSETYLASLSTEFGVVASPGTSILLARIVDEAGDPIAGIAQDTFDVGALVGPFFLDANNAPDAALTETSASGYVVLFDVPPGLVAIDAAAGSGFTMSMPDSPSAANVATLADVVTTVGERPPLPTNVSFANDLVPIFVVRGCDLCHDGNGIGKDLGGLHLNGSAEKMYKEVAEETSLNHGGILRVNVEVPEDSLMLTLPSREEPPDVHPNVTFASQDDPDYLLILGWITEGALDN